MRIINKIIKNRLLEKNIKFRYDNFSEAIFEFPLRELKTLYNSKLYFYNLDKINYYSYYLVAKVFNHEKQKTTKINIINFNNKGQQLKTKNIIIKYEQNYN